MADADVKLDGRTAIVEGSWLLVKCWDIKLDADDRRKQSGGHRRALVHGFNDELVVNWADDYPGGVTIAGDVRIPGKIKQNHVRLESTDLHIDHPARRKQSGGYRRALVHGFNDELVVNWADDYPGGITIRGDVRIPGKVKQNHVRLESTDLHIDHPDRRKQSGGYRRAVVHGFNDELVLNYAKDYPGGTVIQGNFEVQKGGTVTLKNQNGDVVIRADRYGNLQLGGGGQDGDITLKDGNGKAIIRLDAQNDRIDFREPGGSVRVRVDSDHFTEADWPAWPDGTSPSRLDLIKELRRMKEEILTLRTQVDELMAP